MKRNIASLLVLTLFALIGGCKNGTDSNSWGGPTEVDQITSDNSVIVLGKSETFRVNFSYDEESVFNQHGAVHLVIKLPSELSYRTDDAEIKGSSSHYDKQISPTVVRCSSNVTYLSFSFFDNDLNAAEAPSDTADAQLKLSLYGRAIGANVVVEAAASSGNVPFGCSTTFIPQEQEVVTVH